MSSPEAIRRLNEEAERWIADRPTIRPSVWAAANIHLPAVEQRGAGPLSWMGREFAVEVVDQFAEQGVEDVVACFGSQIGKTVIIMSGLAYLIANDPVGVIWVLPDITLARSFSSKRWMPLVESCPALADLIPKGANRHDWAMLEQEINGAVINFVGSNSRSGLSSRPKSVVVLDEMDKFPPETRGGEAGAINLAEQRVKDAARPKRIKTSTPSTTDGPGWVEFLKGDQRRYQVPCPHCGKFVFLAWSKDTALKHDARDAYCVWDDEAKGPNGWDYDRVIRSARCVCPHCSGHIQDHHKLRMMAGGQWVATALAPSTFRSYHLPSLYASSPTTSLGMLAKRALELKRSFEGLQGFINGDLAEPWVNQSSESAYAELSLSSGDLAPVAAKVERMMTVDVQRTSPRFYWVVREWAADGSGHSRRVGVGTAEEWEQLRAVQLEFGVRDQFVIADSGDGDATTEVYRECSRWGEKKRVGHAAPVHAGWRPAKGHPRAKLWRSKVTGRPTITDANTDTTFGGSEYLLPLFQFNSHICMDRLDALRSQDVRRSLGVQWEVVADPFHDGEYYRHLRSKVRMKTTVAGREVVDWETPKGRADHWLDCELMQIALAVWWKLFPLGLTLAKEPAQTP